MVEKLNHQKEKDHAAFSRKVGSKAARKLRRSSMFRAPSGMAWE